jgi:Flp pilus assembly protein TadG
MAAADPHRDRGSAVVDFVLVTGLLTALFLGIVQVGVALHVRNVLVAAAAEGARAGAAADRGPADAERRTRQLIVDALPDGYAEDVQAQQEVVDGRVVVTVRVAARLPVVGFLGPDRMLTVRGHALEEAP